MSAYIFILPEVLVLLGALQALFGGKSRASSRSVAIISALFVAAAGVAVLFTPLHVESAFGSLLVYDELGRFSRLSILVAAFVWLVWSAGKSEARSKEAHSLMLFACIGCLLLSSANELITMFVALELSALPLYVLMGYSRNGKHSLEGALKYFLLSMLTTMIMLYGLSFVYGLSGSTQYGEIALATGTHPVAIAVIVSLCLVGMFAKLSAAPFHFWAPDAFAGASSWVLAFTSTVPKIAAVCALTRFVQAISPEFNADIALVIGVVAATSMVLGNLAALLQTNLKRLMAYSSIAHAGYLMVAVSTLQTDLMVASVIYIVMYTAATMGIMLIAQQVGPELAHFNGLALRKPALAWSMVILLCSLIGIPPLAGFFGKLYLFVSALKFGLLWLVVVAILMSVVSCGYYLRVVYVMFFAAPTEETEQELAYEEQAGLPMRDDQPDTAPSMLASLAISLCVVASLVMGVAIGAIAAFAGM